VFLPVVESPSKSDLAAVKAAYGCALRADRKPQDFLVVIDDVMAQKSKNVQQPLCNIAE
jgi:hypothetical protein